MPMGLVGRKAGMTRVFTDAGESIPVSVIEVFANRVTQKKTQESDGYTAVQVTAGQKKASRVSKAMAGHFAKANVEAGIGLWEFKLTTEEVDSVQAGEEVSVELLSEGQKVDVIGTSKGKGFAGTVKRHNFATQDNTHGNSLAHRAPGSIGQNQSPGRVFKGKKMAGQMGNVRCTVQNLEVVKVDADKKLILIRGAVPGATGSSVIIKPAVKLANKNT